jgi:hypothetical protein
MGGKKVKNPISDEQAAEFEQHMAQWQQTLGLTDWRIERKKQRTAQFAAVVDSLEYEHRLAKYRVGSSFGGREVTSYTLSRTALHEVLHVFLYGLIEAVANHGKDGDDCLAEEHRIIHILEPLLCPPEHTDAHAPTAG